MGIGCDPGIEVSRFCFMFCCHNNSVSNEKKMVYGCKGTKRCPILYGSVIWVILCVIAGKINNMLLCVKIKLIRTCLMY